MSTSFGKDPQNPRDGGDGEGGKWPEVIGGGSSNIDGTGWGIKHLSDPHNPRNGGDHDSITKTGGIILKVGGDSGYIGGEGGYVNDGSGWVIEDPTDTINGDDQYDAAGQDRIGSTEYGGRTSEDISGGEGLDHEWYVEGDFYIVDPTWVSAHTSTFNSGHTNSFSGDWGT